MHKKEACSLSCSIEEQDFGFFPEKKPHIKRQHDGCMQSCSGIPNVWVGVVSLMVLAALMVDSPKAQANLFQASSGLKFLLICPRSQLVDEGFGSAVDMALQSSFVLFLGSSAFSIFDSTFHGQWHICRVRRQAPCSGKCACLGNHTRKTSTVEVVKAMCQKNSTANATAQKAQLWDC